MSFKNSTMDIIDPTTQKELRCSKFRRNKRNNKDIARRIKKKGELDTKRKKLPSIRFFDEEYFEEYSKKKNDLTPFIFEIREDNIYWFPKSCGCHWSLDKGRWYSRHHRDRKRKGINKDKLMNIPIPPSYCSRYYIKQVISDGFKEITCLM